MKKLNIILSAILALCLLAGCAAETASPAETSAEPTAEASLAPSESAELSAAPLPSAGSGAAEIVMSGDSASISGSGVISESGLVTITAPGSYRLSGSFSGQLLVSCNTDGPVELILDGAEIENPTGDAIFIEDAGEAKITLIGDNALISGGDDTVAAFQAAAASEDLTALDAISGAALESKADLTISGDGSLTVTGNVNNGIHGKDDLIIESGTLSVSALNDGIKAKDNLTVSGGVISVSSGGDGIQAKNAEDLTLGNITITGGAFNISADGDGVSAENVMEISGGEFHILAGGGNVNAEIKSGPGFGPPPGWGRSAVEEDTVSIKGLKSAGSLVISGGIFNIDACDDAIHSNDLVSISGGEFTMATGDDGIHADNNVTISDSAHITISTSYEGIEGAVILITGGETDDVFIDLAASDDGMNAGGGNDGGMGGPFGQDRFAAGTKYTLTIESGYVHVNAGGDGLDSNGSLYMAGGEVYVDGPTDSFNGPLDSGRENGGELISSGGLLLAVGSTGMAETFEKESSQCSFQYKFDQKVAADTVITVTDKDGGVIVEYTCLKEVAGITLTSPKLSLYETYTITAGSQTGTIIQESMSASNITHGGRGGGRPS